MILTVTQNTLIHALKIVCSYIITVLMQHTHAHIHQLQEDLFLIFFLGLLLNEMDGEKVGLNFGFHLKASRVFTCLMSEGSK